MLSFPFAPELPCPPTCPQPFVWSWGGRKERLSLKGCGEGWRRILEKAGDSQPVLPLAGTCPQPHRSRDVSPHAQTRKQNPPLSPPNQIKSREQQKVH